MKLQIKYRFSSFGGIYQLDFVTSGLSCTLSDTYYYDDTNQAGRFTNTNDVAKTVNLAFQVKIATKANGKVTISEQVIRCSVTIGLNIPTPSTSIIINSVSKVETILFGTDCGLSHAYGTSYNPNGHMEKDVWKFAYDINFTKNNASVSDSDIYWEWIVQDISSVLTSEKQFLVYPYGTTKLTTLNGNKKVTVEANDYLDEYESKVIVRAKSRSTGVVYSAVYTFYFTAVNH